MREVKLTHKSYDDFLLNLSEGSKMLSCSALSCAFILGMRAFTFEGGSRHYPTWNIELAEERGDTLPQD
jgi:hypothetical protein